jgi:hypothetical protein
MQTPGRSFVHGRDAGSAGIAPGAAHIRSFAAIDSKSARKCTELLLTRIRSECVGLVQEAADDDTGHPIFLQSVGTTLAPPLRQEQASEAIVPRMASSRFGNA